MADNTRNEFYIQELRSALQEYQKLNKEVLKLSEERRQRARLVKSLLSILKIQHGDSLTQDLLAKAQLENLAKPFMVIDHMATAGAKTVVRRRKGEKKSVDPATVLPKGTKVKMLSGSYEGYSGTVASAQAKQGRKGLDVTYFLNLVGPKGDRKRTSVKHGTLRKSWVTTE
jgi:transcription antitermination factor NusG